MVSWWVLDILKMTDGPLILGAWVIWVILSITLHELAHGWAAIRRGDTTPIDTGHMTFNPIVHMGMTSLIVFAISGIAWGAMPVDPTRLRGKYADTYVSVAGPVMNFLLAIGCIVIGGVLEAFEPVTGTPPKLLHDFGIFFWIGGVLNVALGLFNLIPIPPLDGSRILANFARWYREFIVSEAGGFLSFIGFALAFFFASGLIFGVGAAVVVVGRTLIVLVLHGAGVGPAAVGAPSP